MRYANGAECHCTACARLERVIAVLNMPEHLRKALIDQLQISAYEIDMAREAMPLIPNRENPKWCEEIQVTSEGTDSRTT